ncbi:MAG: hypothetical protein V5783_11655 [Pontiella sp.]
MAKKLIPLTARDILLQADAETIREALEARVKIDELLVKREEAYRQIEEIELQVEGLVGEEGIFVYPEPPVPVAGFSKPVPASRPKLKIAKPEPEEVEVVAPLAAKEEEEEIVDDGVEEGGADTEATPPVEDESADEKK